MARLCQKAIDDGIEVEHVHRLIRTCKLTPKSPGIVSENWPFPVKIFTLGQFDLRKDDTTQKPSRKTQHKPLHMLKLLIAFGGEGVAEEQLSDQLWPDADGDLAHESFKTTLFRLRNLLEESDAILHAGQKPSCKHG